MRIDVLQTWCAVHYARDVMCSFRRRRVSLVQDAHVSWGAAIWFELPVACLQLVKDMGFLLPPLLQLSNLREGKSCARSFCHSKVI
jgi:hypothetical protein